MRKFVRILALLILCVMCLTLTACKNDKNNAEKSDTPATADSATKDSAEVEDKKDDEYKAITENIAEQTLNIMWVEFDASKAYELTHPATIDKALEVTGLSKNEYIALLQSSLDDVKKDMEDSDGSVKWKILKHNPLDTERLNELTAMYKEINLEVEATDVVLLEHKIYENDKEVGYYIQEITCVKVDGKWYLADFGAM